MISVTADGASVNFEAYNGLPWLLKIHCSNHRTELATKTVFSKESVFKEVKDLYVAIFYFHKNSGKVLNKVK